MGVSLVKHRELLAAYLRPQRARVALLALLILAGIALQLFNPQVIRFFIDTAQAGGPAARGLLPAALLYLAVGLAGRGLQYAASFTGLNVAWTATNALRADLIRHALRLDMPFHKTHTPGELIERLDGDVSALGDFFSQMVVKAAANALLVIAILFLLYRENLWAGLVLTAYTLVALAVLAVLQNLGARRWAAARQAWADQSSFVEEHLAGAEDIRGVGAERYVFDKFVALTRAIKQQARAGWMANALGFAVTNFLYVAGYGLGLAIGAILFTRGSVSVGAAFLIVYYIGMLAAPLDAIREQAKELGQASGSIARIGEILAVQPQVRESPRGQLLGGALGVAFDHVSFAYHDREAEAGEIAEPVVREVTFALAPGRVVGLLGRTGSGKTTLTRLLARLYDPQAGTITLGAGLDLRDVAFADLRARVAVVTQDVQLFSASVRDNITLFDPGVSDARIRAALDRLGLADWVDGMPGGLDARLAAEGGGLSAGEAQLLAFTRILLRDPGLVILDEAASRLDPVSEARLARAVEGLLVGRTAIIVAHRLRTVQRADEIMILEAGRIVEHGARARLTADPGSRFAGLLRAGLEEALA